MSRYVPLMQYALSCVYDPSGGYYKGNITAGNVLESGKAYTVVFDGRSYSYEASKNGALGNASLYSRRFADTGEPFYFAPAMGLIFADAPGQHTLSYGIMEARAASVEDQIAELREMITNFKPETGEVEITAAAIQSALGYKPANNGTVVAMSADLNNVRSIDLPARPERIIIVDRTAQGYDLTCEDVYGLDNVVWRLAGQSEDSSEVEVYLKIYDADGALEKTKDFTGYKILNDSNGHRAEIDFGDVTVVINRSLWTVAYANNSSAAGGGGYVELIIEHDYETDTLSCNMNHAAIKSAAKSRLLSGGRLIERYGLSTNETSTSVYLASSIDTHDGYTDVYFYNYDTSISIDEDGNVTMGM